MEVTKQDSNAYVLQSEGIKITALNTGRGWGVTGDTPPSLMGKFASIGAVQKAFEKYIGILRDEKAIADNPLTNIEISLDGTILDPKYRFGPPPKRAKP